MALVAPAITVLWIAGTRYLVAPDPTRPPRPSCRAFRRAARAGRLPTLRQAFVGITDYVRADHHPSHHGAEAAAAYLARSPAAASA